MAEVGALLLNWRQPEMTRQCLLDLAAAADASLEVLVIDNGSGDDSAARLQAAVAQAKALGLGCELLCLPHNRGFAGGMNAGFAWAQDRGLPYALVLNNDLRLPKGFLPPMLAAMQNDARLGAVTPTVLLPDGRVWAQGGSLGFCANGIRLNGHGGRPAPATLGPQAVDFAPGACLLLRTGDAMALGGFDESYFMYWEDAELCRRLAAMGRRIVWLPWVQVTHLGGASAGGGRSPLRKMLMAKNSVRYLRQHGAWSGWLRLLCCDVLTLPLLLAFSPRSFWPKALGLLSGLRGAPSSEADVRRWA